VETDKITCSLALMGFRISPRNAFTNVCFYAVNLINHAIFENRDQISVVDKFKCVSQS
jgi:hypothetical protein